MRGIDLSCKIVAPLLAGFVMTFASPVKAAMVIGMLCVVCFVYVRMCMGGVGGGREGERGVEKINLSTSKAVHRTVRIIRMPCVNVWAIGCVWGESGQGGEEEGGEGTTNDSVWSCLVSCAQKHASHASSLRKRGNRSSARFGAR